ncbi:MAG: DOMON domain-containing protein, partial [Planctomycetota bacterium]
GIKECGVVELFVSPDEEGELIGEARLAFELAPRESFTSDLFTLTPAPGHTHLEIGIRRVGTVDLPTWHHLYLQHEVSLSDLGRTNRVDELTTLLADTAPIKTATWNGEGGTVRMGFTEGGMAICLDLHESEVDASDDDNWWRGSSIELFGAGPANPIAEQVGLVPAGDGTAAQALWFHNGIRQESAPGAEVTSTRTANGYCLTAFIPDTLLGWDRTQETPRLEISITAKPSADKPRQTIRVFGVEIWMNERHRFGLLKNS